MMGHFTLATSKTVKSLDKESDGTQMAPFMMVNGNLVSKMEKEYCGIRMAVASSDNSNKIKSTAKDKPLLQTATRRLKHMILSQTLQQKYLKAF